MIKDQCPCGSGRRFTDCCGPFIDGDRLPETAEQCMRSRYSAYCRGNLDYLRATWDPKTLPDDLTPGPPVTWLGLKILATEAGGPEDDTGMVEFVVRYKAGGWRARRLHERGLFVRLDGRWRYLDADETAQP